MIEGVRCQKEALVLKDDIDVQIGVNEGHVALDP